MFHAKRNQKQVGVAMLLPGKTDLGAKTEKPRSLCNDEGKQKCMSIINLFVQWTGHPILPKQTFLTKARDELQKKT